MASASASSSSSSSSSSSLSSVVDLCSSSSAQTSDSYSSWNGSLWNDVDLAERFLISSKFDEAAAICSIILQKLKDVSSISEPPEQFEGIDGGIDEDEVEDMIESAGMVLIQAYSESGRSGMIFNDLETVFGCLAKVPPSMFLAGVCLQISAGLHLDAQMSLESFLQDWAFTSVGEESCMFKPTSKQNHGSICLKPETYIEITELYCVQVLAKGLRNMEMAVHWVKEVDIPADTKQDILEKLERVSLSLDRKDNKGLISHHKVTGGTPKAGAYSDYSAWRSLVSEPVETTDENRIKQQAFKEVDPQSLLRSFHLFSPFMELISGWMASSSVDYSLHASRWHKVLTVVSQRKATFSGAATVFLMIALYKQRLNLSRVLGGFGKVLGNLLRAIYIGVFDLWQLAFNVQLNPLAAVQPMPSSYYVR